MDLRSFPHDSQACYLKFGSCKCLSLKHRQLLKIECSIPSVCLVQSALNIIYDSRRTTRKIYKIIRTFPKFNLLAGLKIQHIIDPEYHRIHVKTNIKPRHDVIYVDKLTCCIQGTYLSIRWWSVMWHDSQSCLRVSDIRQYKRLVTFSIIPSCFHHHSEHIFWRKQFSLPPLPYRHLSDWHLCYCIFTYQPWGAFFAPPLLKMIIWLPWTLLTINFHLSVY